MSDIVFIGDEITALGYRLAGARVVVAPDDVVACFEQAMREASLLVITGEYAAKLPERVLEPALRKISPPVVIVPDVERRVAAPDLARRVRRELGVLP